MNKDIIAQSDVGIELYAKGETNFEAFLDITSVPAQGSAGGNIEVTVLKSAIKQYIADRPDTPDQDFNYNYTEGNFTKAQEKCDGIDHEFLVKFQDGTGYVIKGTAQTWINEIGRGSAVEATLHIVASNITWKTSEEVTALLA